MCPIMQKDVKFYVYLMFVRYDIIVSIVKLMSFQGQIIFFVYTNDKLRKNMLTTLLLIINENRDRGFHESAQFNRK